MNKNDKKVKTQSRLFSYNKTQTITNTTADDKK